MPVSSAHGMAMSDNFELKLVCDCVYRSSFEDISAFSQGPSISLVRGLTVIVYFTVGILASRVSIRGAILLKTPRSE